MKLPGNNSLTFSQDSLEALLSAAIEGMFGGEGLRITNLQLRHYPTRLDVEFTTDPAPQPRAPEPEPTPEAPPDVPEPL